MPPATNTPPKQSAAPERRSNSGWTRSSGERDPHRRAQLKRDLKAGRVSIHELLLEPPEYLETAKVFDMLLAVPKYGRVKVNKILAQCRISPSKTIGGLSERQRAELVPLAARDSRGAVFVITGPSGVGKGTLIRACSSACPSSSCRCRRRRAAPRPGGDATASTTGSCPTRSSTRACRGRVRRAGRVLRPPLRDAARRARAALGGRPGRAGDRGAGRAPGARDDARGGPDLHRAAVGEALRARLVGRGTDDPEQVERRLARPRGSSRRRTSSRTSWSTTGSRTPSRSWSASSGRAWQAPEAG